jgi:hypothetical protein
MPDRKLSPAAVRLVELIARDLAKTDLKKRTDEHIDPPLAAVAKNRQ